MKAKKEGNMNSVIPSGLFQHSIEKNRHKIMNLGDFDD